jgi:hypothetical protein
MNLFGSPARFLFFGRNKGGSVTSRSLCGLIAVFAWTVAAPAQLKQDMRMPWERGNERFIRQWLVLSDIPLAGATDGFAKDWLAEHGGETAIRPVAGMTHQLGNGSKVSWRAVTARATQPTSPTAWV